MPLPAATADLLNGISLWPLLAALLVGGIVGFEREMHGRPAGLRTHMLVCLSSAVLIQASRFPLDHALPQSDLFRIVFDPNRLASGIMTGIGFLGAATVIRAGDIVRGVTTGATVWTVAGLGIVVGQGEYALAIAASLMVVLVLAVVDRFTRGIAPVIYRRLVVRGQRSELTQIARRVGDLLRDHRIRLQDLSGTRAGPEEPFELVFHVRCRNVRQAPEMLELVASQPGVTSVEWSEIAH